jgi:hypothetical protein
MGKTYRSQRGRQRRPAKNCRIRKNLDESARNHPRAHARGGRIGIFLDESAARQGRIS